MQSVGERSDFQVDGGRMAYLDVGQGAPVVFVHGNPSSSHEYEPVISQIMSHRRCIAADHIGFGASDKPADWDYLPVSHARNLARLLDSLDLEDVTLVVSDWGGPIGLSWALDRPDRVRRLVVSNTWMWSVRGSLHFEAFSRLMGGPLGRTLTRRFNFFASQVVKRAWGSATPLSPDVHAGFTSVHPRAEERKGMWVFPREITRSGDWLDGLWARRSALARHDLTLLWGMDDIAFRPDELATWQAAFPGAATIRLEGVGHFPALEATDAMVRVLLGDS